jgi:cell wall-associated NlpC family hydrolase
MVQSLKQFKGCTMTKFFTKTYFLTLCLSCTLFIFTGCSIKQEQHPVQLPNQNIELYAHNFEALPQSIKHNLYQRHFAPWKQKKVSLKKKDASWGAMYAQKKMYGVNHQRLEPSWFKEQLNNANFDDFATQNLKAITIKNSNLRIFPTALPLFYNPLTAGEGFPFDYNQNSGIKINTPIMISHFTKDKAWAYVESNFASGFIPSSDIAIVNDEIIQAFKQSSYYVAIKDNFPVYKNGIYKETIKLGTIIPKSKYGNFFVVNQYHNLEGYLQTIRVPEETLVHNALQITPQNITDVINELLNEPYGWGEAFLNRDCSALTKDYFAAFGVNLNRNSRQQTKNGQYISLKELSNEEKKAFILKEGKPFFTLIYLKGHIMLYVGSSKENEPLAFHNLWGIKTKDSLGNEGRNVVGKAVISELDIGKELDLYDEKSSILTKIEGIVLIK